MICPNCGSPCRDVEGQPRSLVHEVVDIVAAIEAAPQNPDYVLERVHAAQGIVTAAISDEVSGNRHSPNDPAVPRQEVDVS